jgi:hypothetical protein
MADRGLTKISYVHGAFMLASVWSACVELQKREKTMRMTLLAAAAVIGLGFATPHIASAAPAYGTAIHDAAAKVDLTQDVWWHRWHRWGWRRGFCWRHPYAC